jgi:hypothetical protein
VKAIGMMQAFAHGVGKAARAFAPSSGQSKLALSHQAAFGTLNGPLKSLKTSRRNIQHGFRRRLDSSVLRAEQSTMDDPKSAHQELQPPLSGQDVGNLPGQVLFLPWNKGSFHSDV